MGIVQPDEYFNVMEPFITPDHFHTMLLTKLGLQYEHIKTKQLFSLIDLDHRKKTYAFSYNLQ